ncbi:hypothetical protein LIER_31108 [Lithospermum erythrorhizon]|uniref:Uncharacterized protein n=1 Tax=Lithospermum erythrorhizon TaxID=34254 RepID=A0AAV3RV83_LITER
MVSAIGSREGSVFILDLVVDKVRKITEILSHNMLVSVTIDIYEGRYPHYAEYPYLKPNNNMLPKCTHLVVIVGLYTATENDQHGLKPGTYFLYQDSLRHYDSRDNGTRGLFSNCIGILDPELITLGYLGISKIPNFMLSVETANERKAYFDAKLQNKRKDIADLVEFRKTEQT